MKLNTISIRVAVSACLISLLPSLSYSEEINLSKWYVTATLGASIINDPSSDYKPNNGVDQNGKLKVDSGMLFGGSVGYYLMPDVRIEGEVVYRSNDISSSSIPSFNRRQSSSDIASVMYMANIYKDFDLFSTSFANFKPYLGVGVGIAQETDVDATVNGVKQEFSDNNRFAYQALTGINWYYRSGWFAGLGLRYMDAGKPRLDGNTGDLKVDYDGLSTELKIGFKF
jgi:opacity protein-like surface antigen